MSVNTETQENPCKAPMRGYPSPRGLMKKVGKHRKDCQACEAVHAGKKATVWMTPELVENKLLFVCADAGCQAKLSVLNVQSLRLPKF